MAERLSIAHYLPRIRLEEGGVVRCVIDLVGALASAGHEVRLLTHDPADAPREWADLPSLTLTTIAGPSRSLGRLNDAELTDVRARLEGVEVMHLHTPWEPANLQLASVARSLGKPYILSVHGMLDDWSMSQRTLKKRLYLALAGKKLIGGAAAVHCTAQGELDQVSRWLYGARGVVVPLLIDIGPFQTLPGPEIAAREYASVPADVGRVLFLSRLHIKKGVEHLLDAVAQLRSDGVNCHALLAGTGDDAYVATLKERARSLGLDDAAHFVGHVGGDLKISLYEWADVFVLPTSQENFGLVLPEALACRTPVVTTKGVDIWPELEASGGAIIVDPEPAMLASEITALLADPDRLRQMGERGRQWVMERLTPDVVVGAYESLYRGVAARDDAS